MRIKDPINFALWTASTVLGILALYLYWPDIYQKTPIQTDEPFQPQIQQQPPIPAPQLTSAAKSQGISLDTHEHARYQTMQKSLQQVLQDVHALDQENTRLKQEIQKNAAENKILGTEIDKLRPNLLPSTPH